MLTGQLYLLQCISKNPSSTCCKALKTQQIGITDMREKPENFFKGAARLSTFALGIILRTWVPYQKFLFLFNLQFFVHTCTTQVELSTIATLYS